MALRALLFSKNPETASALVTVAAEAGIRAEICADIFSALDQGTKQPFAAIIADWADQPEAGFLLKRARESEPNRRTVAIAVVDNEPTPDQMREQRLDYLVYRPVSADEARSVLTKARQQMQVQSSVYSPELRSSALPSDIGAPSDDPEDPNLVAVAADLPEQHEGGRQATASTPEELEDPQSRSSEQDDGPAFDLPEPALRNLAPRLRAAALVTLLIAAGVLLLRSRGSFLYIVHTPEGSAQVLRQSLAAVFFSDRSGAASVGSAAVDAQQDAYFSRQPARSGSAQPSPVNVVDAGVALPGGPQALPQAFDFPLPTPQLEHSENPKPVRSYNPVPDSIRSSPPITAPLVVAVNPAQIMPVSTPIPPLPQVSEPVLMSEEAARALAIQTPAPVYPGAALSQKLQGSVVLQVVIGRDGTVQEVKLVRGYFLLARAAIAAVKQWRFQPYSVNGHAATTQTSLTVNFNYPGT